MKKIHYKNIGYPKTGTNWLWLQLMNHPQVDAKFQIYRKEFVGKNLEEYKKVYEQYTVSINLETHVFANLRQNTHFTHPTRIHECATHLTLTFRNLYEVLNSMFNMERNRDINFKMTGPEFLQSQVKMYCDTKKIFEDWSECRLPIKYLFYDDLVSNPKAYMHEICRYIGLAPFYTQSMSKVFRTDKRENLVFEDENLIKYINDGISIIEDYTKRNLSHWKK